MTLNHAEKRVVDALHVACVRGIIAHYAHHLHLLVSYGAVADTVKHAIRGRGLAEILATIAEEDHSLKLPLSTAVVVNSETERPGKGFFEQARSLGILIGRTPGAEEAFWQTQLQLLRVNPLTLKAVVERQESGVIDIPFVVPATGPLPKDYAQRIQENSRQRGTSPDMTPVSHPCHDMDSELAKAELSSGASVLPGDNFVTPSGDASHARTPVNLAASERELLERVAQAAGDRATPSGNARKTILVPTTHLRVGDVVLLRENQTVPNMRMVNMVKVPVGVTGIRGGSTRKQWTDTNGNTHDIDLSKLEHLEVVQF